MNSVSAGNANQLPHKPRRGRRGRLGQTGSEARYQFSQKPFSQPTRITAPVDLLSTDQIEHIHTASLKILCEIGINILHDDARQIMKNNGAIVKQGETMVRFDPDLILDAIKTIPEQIEIHARNPAHNIQMGGDKIAFLQMASAPNCNCMDHGRRPGSHEDFRRLIKLAQVHNIIHMVGGYPVEPLDLHPSIRHLECLYDMLTLSDKAISAYSLGKGRIRDGMELARIAHGMDQEQFVKHPVMFTVINTNSPLQIDIPMAQGLMDFAKMGQLSVVTPFTLAGAMAPVTIAGALALQNAEALAALAFTQMIKPGAPAMYGGFTSNVDMKSGAPAFGTPEYLQAQHAGGQLARRYNIPYRSSNTCAANTVDAQAAYESVFSLWGAINGGAHMLKHGAGWMEGGLTCSFEKFILDVDLLQMVAEFLTPLEVNEQTIGLDAILEAGPGGHFFGTQHTQERYRDAFYAPVLSDWRNYESWQQAGSPNAMEKANKVYKERLQCWEKPALDQAIEEEMRSFVDRRIAEGGVPTDF